MTIHAKISGPQRRAAIIKTARAVFVEKGFYRTTTRELAEAAGVSEALLFKHFPSKEDLYAAIQTSCLTEEAEKAISRLEAMEPSTAALAYLVRDLASHLLGRQPDEDHRAMVCLILRSLMDEGEFAQLAVQTGPLRWVGKVQQCLRAARRAGDMVNRPPPAALAGWLAHQLIVGIMIHDLPAEPVIDYGVSHEELVKQVVGFCLRGMGLTDEAVRRCLETGALL